jgi:hypothetical protein
VIVPWHDPHEMLHVHDFDSHPESFHGCVSGVDDRVTDDTPRRPIGFRKAAPDPTPPDPSWMLL